MGAIASAFLGVFAVLFGLAANILATLTGTFLAAAVWLFNWVLSKDFISLSYTGLDNPFIEIGWKLTSSLANIFFVVAFVVIGLGTALRLANYQAQKTLPTLIIIALLINFTPVIAGLIVDASNIVMNFFIQGGFAGGNSFVKYAFGQWSNISSLVGGVKFWDPTASGAAIAAAAGSIILIWFNLIAALIYTLFAFLFIVRYIAIWILVILSPLAFASYILPSTKMLWSQWWKQFTQWCLFGPVAAFFLYLSDHFIRIATSGNFIQKQTTEIVSAPGFSTVMNNILPYFISLILLFIGLIASMSFAPQGASAVMKAGERGIKRAGAITQKWGWEGAKATTRVPGAIKRYGEARRAPIPYGGGSPTVRQSLGAAWQRIKRPEPGTLQKAWGKVTPHLPDDVRAAGGGLQRAAADVWRTTTHGKAKVKKCPGDRGKPCGKTIDASLNVCPHCQHIFA